MEVHTIHMVTRMTSVWLKLGKSVLTVWQLYSKSVPEVWERYGYRIGDALEKHVQINALLILPEATLSGKQKHLANRQGTIQSPKLNSR